MVLGSTGRNFAAGMSGGIGYVYDPDADFKDKVNLSMVGLESLTSEDKETLHNLLVNHHKYTNSLVAKNILNQAEEGLEKFVKVLPVEYKKILEGKTLEQRLELAELLDG